MKKTLLLISLLVILALPACSGSSSPSLTGEWKLVSFGSTPALPDVVTSIVFDDDKVNGNVGCNGFSGDYKIEGNKIIFGRLSSTMMACDDPRMRQEAEVFSVLANITEFTIDGNTLTIASSDGQSSVTLVKK